MVGNAPADQLAHSGPYVRPATIPELQRLMRHFRERAQYATADQLAWSLRPIMHGHKATMRTFEPGTRLYRGRVMIEPPRNVREVGYPPAAVVAMGRANRAGEPMLYVTTSDDAVFYETRANIGDALAVVEYDVTAPLSYMSVGYTQAAAGRLESTREVPEYGRGLTTDREAFVEEFLAEIFTPIVASADDEWRYQASIAIAANFLNNDLADALMFPTISMRADADNLAIRTRFADRGLRAVSVGMWEKTEQLSPFEHRFAYRDASTGISPGGQITWNGGPAMNLTRQGEWVVVEAQDGAWHVRHRGIGDMPRERMGQPLGEPM